MEHLAIVIVDSAQLFKQLFVSLASEQGNTLAQDEVVLWDNVSSIAYSIFSFLTELIHEIATIM